MFFVYLEGLLVFHEGVRQNDSKRMRAGRLALLPLWFGRNHPHYQAIIVTDELERMRYAPEIKKEVEAAEGVTKCLTDTHEGAAVS